MATIHTGTTMVPSKLDLLADWLPRQPWYRSTGAPPSLAKAGGFRLDDPAGHVGIEFVFVTDAGETTYHVPLAYRGAPLPGAEAGLLGTSEHGVLGRRWIYDAAYDPVAVNRLLEFIGGGAEAQHQSRSDTPDRSVVRHQHAAGRLTAPIPLRVRDSEPEHTTVAVELTDPSSARGVQGSLHVVRVLRAGPAAGGDDLALVEAEWTLPDESTGRGAVVVVR